MRSRSSPEKFLKWSLAKKLLPVRYAAQIAPAATTARTRVGHRSRSRYRPTKTYARAARDASGVNTTAACTTRGCSGRPVIFHSSAATRAGPAETITLHGTEVPGLRFGPE